MAKKISSCLVLLFFLLAPYSYALDVIPDLKVFGGDTRAAYGNSQNPTICVVNTLNPTTAIADSTRNGVAVKTGGLKSFIDYNIDNKLIIFEVSGYILYDGKYRIDNDYITIAGQTAPSPGITLRNTRVVVKDVANDVLIQHIRIRMDDCGTGDGTDCGENFAWRKPINVFGSNVVIDHCSLSWGTDAAGAGLADGHDVTFSNCIMAEGLHDSYHPDGPHSRGFLTTGGLNYGIINNLFIHNYSRNPTMGGNDTADLLVANNLVYNPQELGSEVYPRTAIDDVIWEGNQLIEGPDSGTYAATKIITWFDQQNLLSDWYINDNRTDDGEGGEVVQTGPTDWSNVRYNSGTNNDACQVESIPFSYPTGYTPMASDDVDTYVKANAGARPADRDSADTRLVLDVTNLTGGVIDSPSDVGWPELAENTDTHNDLPSDPHSDAGSGYTYLEEWLHEFSAIVEGGSQEPAAPTPDPMEWSVEPAGLSTTEIDMTAITASDETPPIEYAFDFDVDSDNCGSDADIGTGGTDSGWQSADTTYTDGTLQVNQVYCYTVQARDSDAPTSNTASSSVKAYTLAATPASITFENEGANSVEVLAHDENGNPATNPITTFAIQCVSTNPADANWEGKWIQADGSAGASEAWMTDAAITALTISGMDDGTVYGFQSKGKNGDGTETVLGTLSYATTTGAPTPPPTVTIRGGKVTGGKI